MRETLTCGFGVTAYFHPTKTVLCIVIGNRYTSLLWYNHAPSIASPCLSKPAASPTGFDTSRPNICQKRNNGERYQLAWSTSVRRMTSSLTRSRGTSPLRSTFTAILCPVSASIVSQGWGENVTVYGRPRVEVIGSEEATVDIAKSAM